VRSGKTAFLFPGQGSQAVGMLDPWIQDAAGRAALDRAETLLGIPLSRLMSAGPAGVLDRSEVAQPALVAAGVLQARRLSRMGLEPDLLIGHSAGAFAALVVAEALDFETGVRMARVHARLLTRAMPAEGGRMIAILGAERESVAEACRAARRHGVVDVACHNAPGHTVISGARSAVERAADQLEGQGAMAVALNIPLAAHCQLLRPVADEFARFVASCAVSSPRLPVLDNVSARPLASAEDVRRSLVGQLTLPVLFEECVEAGRGMGVVRFVECGPGESLSRCVRRQCPGLEAVACARAIAGTAAVGGHAGHGA
jgi:[acyl-carrier-protein] S-malonyltransferase